MTLLTRPGLALVDRVLVRRRLLCLFGAHRSEIMFGVLIVVLCRDGIAILSFSMGHRQISLIGSLQALKAVWLGSGCGRYPALWPSRELSRSPS